MHQEMPGNGSMIYNGDGFILSIRKMSTTKERNNLFPIFLKLEKLQLLIIGGGYVGLEKLNAVIQNSPATKISLVAREISTEVRALANQYPNILLQERNYQPVDIEAADIVIIAINDRDMSNHIYLEARRRNKLVNVADTPDLCDFYLGSIVQKGNLKIGISTNGKSPTIAKRIKEMLSEALPDQLDELLNTMQLIRNRLKGNFEEKVQQLNELTKVLVEKKQD